MADHSLQRETLEVSAPIDACVAVAADIERYPEWAADLKSVDVVERTDDGHPSLVRFRVAAMGHSTTYTLRYDWSDFPHRISWEQTEGDLTTKLDGFYEFVASSVSDDWTEVHYVLEVELVIPLPAIVKRRGESKLIHTALRELKLRVEELHGAVQA